MIVIVYENHDKWSNVTPVQHFCRGFDQANCVNSFLGSKYSVICIFFKRAFETFYLKGGNISTISGIAGIRHIFQTGGDRCLL